MSKQTLLENLQLENQCWETLLEQVDPLLMDKPGFAGNWSVKDLVAHLTGWQRRTVLRLQAALRGGGGGAARTTGHSGPDNQATTESRFPAHAPEPPCCSSGNRR